MRINISMDDESIELIRQMAKKNHKTVSTFIRDMAWAEKRRDDRRERADAKAAAGNIPNIEAEA